MKAQREEKILQDKPDYYHGTFPLIQINLYPDFSEGFLGLFCPGINDKVFMYGRRRG